MTQTTEVAQPTIEEERKQQEQEISEFERKMVDTGAKLLKESKDHIEAVTEFEGEYGFSVEPFVHRELFEVTSSVVESTKKNVETPQPTETMKVSGEPSLQTLLGYIPQLKSLKQFVMIEFPPANQASLLRTINQLQSRAEQRIRWLRQKKQKEQPTLESFYRSQQKTVDSTEQPQHKDSEDELVLP